MSLTPANLSDEAHLVWDRAGEPQSIELEIELPGRLDPARLRAALAVALRRHPMARAALHTRRRLTRPATWAIHDLDEAVTADAVRVVDVSNDDALDLVRSELHSTSLAIDRAPLVRLVLASHARGDRLLLYSHHGPFDGLGALRLLRSIGRAYGGEDDPVPGVDPIASRDLRRVVGTVNREPFGDRVRGFLAVGGRKTHVAPAAGIDEAAHGNGILHVTAPVPRPPSGATVNDLLLAAAHWAIGQWNDERDLPGGRLGCTMPVNLRPAAWRHEVVGNFTVSAVVVTDHGQRSTPATSLAAITPQTQRLKTTGAAAGVFTLPAPIVRTLPALFPLARPSSQPTATVSNLGVVEAISFGSEVGNADALWFSPPTIMPMGLVVGAATMNDALSLSFRWRHALLDSASARQLADLYVDALSCW